jgi:hypothetical protein
VGKENEFLNAGSGSWREENKTEFLNAGSGGEENKLELKIDEPPMDCRFRQFLVWIMYKTRVMPALDQQQFLHDNYGLSFGSSENFMGWLLDEAQFLPCRYQREFINNVRSGYKIQTRATIGNFLPKTISIIYIHVTLIYLEEVQIHLQSGVVSINFLSGLGLKSRAWVVQLKRSLS